MTAICYKTNVPECYNKGTKYERYCDTFLAYYTCKGIEEAQKEVDEINTNKPMRLSNGMLANCDNCVYFVKNQEAM